MSSTVLAHFHSVVIRNYVPLFNIIVRCSLGSLIRVQGDIWFLYGQRSAAVWTDFLVFFWTIRLVFGYSLNVWSPRSHSRLSLAVPSSFRCQTWNPSAGRFFKRTTYAVFFLSFIFSSMTLVMNSAPWQIRFIFDFFIIASTFVLLSSCSTINASFVLRAIHLDPIVVLHGHIYITFSPALSQTISLGFSNNNNQFEFQRFCRLTTSSYNRRPVRILTISLRYTELYISA